VSVRIPSKTVEIRHNCLPHEILDSNHFTVASFRYLTFSQQWLCC